MILFNGPNTPFGRMAWATAIELGIEIENRVINVFESESIATINPLGQIPVLVDHDGQAVHDSRVICQYLSERADDTHFVPTRGHWPVQTRWSLAIGLMEAGVSRTMELLRPAGEQSAAQIARWERRIDQGIAHLEADADEVCGDAARIDRLSIAVALGYIDFRLKRPWRDAAPKLAAWFADQSGRPSLARTPPRANAAA